MIKAKLGKAEPVWTDEITPEGNKVKIRALKLSYYCAISEFPDALQWDGAEMFISKGPPNHEPTIAELHAKIDTAMALLLSMAEIVKEKI